MLPEGYRYHPETASEVAGTASGDEPGAAVATAREERRSAADVGRDLRLVHRRVRYGGS